jgi:hypothetical protein
MGDALGDAVSATVSSVMAELAKTAGDDGTPRSRVPGDVAPSEGP